MAIITPKDILEKDFFELIGLQDLPEKQKISLLTDMSKTVHARVYGAIYEQLGPEERQELDQVEESKILAYLLKKGFDVPNLIVEEAQRYRIEVATILAQVVEENPALFTNLKAPAASAAT